MLNLKEYSTVTIIDLYVVSIEIFVIYPKLDSTFYNISMFCDIHVIYLDIGTQENYLQSLLLKTRLARIK